MLDLATTRRLAAQLRLDAVRLVAHAGSGHPTSSRSAAVGEDELRTYRRLGSRLEGHPTPRLPWVDVATGSLGLGLPVGVGLALAGRHLDQLPYRVWVLTGDSELA